MEKGVLRILLIIAVFNFETGTALETDMGFDKESDCHAAALLTFQEIDETVTVRAMDVPEGQGMLDGTMIAYRADGSEIGMYACNRLRSISD